MHTELALSYLLKTEINKFADCRFWYDILITVWHGNFFYLGLLIVSDTWMILSTELMNSEI